MEIALRDIHQNRFTRRIHGQRKILGSRSYDDAGRQTTRTIRREIDRVQFVDGIGTRERPPKKDRFSIIWEYSHGRRPGLTRRWQQRAERLEPSVGPQPVQLVVPPVVHPREQEASISHCLRPQRILHDKSRFASDGRDTENALPVSVEI